MKNKITILLTAIIILSSCMNVFASSNPKLDEAIAETASYLYETVQNPQIGAIGGEWAVIGLARSGYDVPDSYYQNYYSNVEAYVKNCGGKLHDKKYTEYSRVIVALTAIGKNPADVAGYNLLTAIGDYDNTIWQGLNGPVWALIALDSGGYEMPQNSDAKTQATRELYLNRILECQLPDGGWSLFGGTAAEESGNSVSDPDITGMALQALAKYQDRPEVKKATEEALACMSAMQNENGGYSHGGAENLESSVQMLTALCELGISADDARFVKNGNTLLDAVLSFRNSDGSFQHTSNDSGNSQMSTEQGFYAMVAAQRALEGKSSLYRMSDSPVSAEDGETDNAAGLPGKHADVSVKPLTKPGVTFADIAGHSNQLAIEALAAREIINGKSADAFDPDATMTRAEYAAIVVKALGLPMKEEAKFEDATKTDWFFPFVNTACSYGIINGISETEFNPNGTITREEAAVMTARAAKLCGMNTELETAAVRDVLAGFTDYVTASDWARSALAFCLREQILSEEEIEILPKQEIKRCEIAQMLYQMLGAANQL
uniref:S-layer homology domain-containing protein n=2 Tax=Congzhengia minquanensis TaxID=2763657 RepID=A0A926HY49_9FIRM|nr:S-layer homology domain-containing protein [Congzhengia minquanensis]